MYLDKTPEELISFGTMYWVHHHFNCSDVAFSDPQLDIAIPVAFERDDDTPLIIVWEDIRQRLRVLDWPVDPELYEGDIPIEDAIQRYFSGIDCIADDLVLDRAYELAGRGARWAVILEEVSRIVDDYHQWRVSECRTAS